MRAQSVAMQREIDATAWSVVPLRAWTASRCLGSPANISTSGWS